MRLNIAQQFELLKTVSQQQQSTKNAKYAKMAAVQNNMKKKLTPQIMQKYKSIQQIDVNKAEKPKAKDGAAPADKAQHSRSREGATFSGRAGEATPVIGINFAKN